MDWKDIELPNDPWPGLDLTIGRDDLPLGAPCFRVEATPTLFLSGHRAALAGCA
jgi:hypothetical protein